MRSLTVRWMLPVGRKHVIVLSRAAVVTGVVTALAFAATLNAAPASADTTVDGSVIETQTSFCTSSSLSARTNMTVISPGAQPQVNQDFHLLVTVTGRNQCLNNQLVSVNVQLPAGITVSTGGQSPCVMFRVSDRGAVQGATTTVPCVRTDAGNGFLRIDPQGGTSWSLSRTGNNVVQVQLAVRASTSGQRTAFAHVCDSGSSVICSGSPVANAIPSVAFTVAAAPQATISAERLLIAENRVVCSGACSVQSITGTSIKVLASIAGQRPAGTWRIQRGGPGSAAFTTIDEKPVTAGAGVQTFRTTATGLQPNTTYKFRACFLPSGGTQVCGAAIQLKTKS